MTDQSAADIARDAVPGLREAERAVAAIRARLDANRQALLAPPPDLAAQVVDAAANGQPVPDNIGEQHLAAGQRGAVIAAEAEVLRRAESAAVSRRDEALRQGADDAVRALRPLLAQVLDAARHAAHDLDGANTADDAIRAGLADQWQQLGDAARRYADIRREQRALYAAAGGYTNVGAASVDFRSLLPTVGDISNIDDVWEGWHAWHAWHVDAEGTPPWPENDDRAYLVWLAGHPEAEAWVPTLAELGEAFHRQQQTAQARERAAEEEAAHGRHLSPEERQRNAERAAARTSRNTQRAARRAAASAY